MADEGDLMEMDSEVESKKRSRKKVAGGNVDTDLLESSALAIYRDLFAKVGHGIEGSKVARDAFAAAKAFHDMAMQIRESGDVPKPEIARRVEVLVHLWEPGEGGTMSPVFDKTGKPLLAEMIGDPDSEAPNLPPDHPVNQRYYLALHALKRPVPARYQAALNRSLEIQRNARGE